MSGIESQDNSETIKPNYRLCSDKARFPNAFSGCSECCDQAQVSTVLKLYFQKARNGVSGILLGTITIPIILSWILIFADRNYERMSLGSFILIPMLIVFSYGTFKLSEIPSFTTGERKRNLTGWSIKGCLVAASLWVLFDYRKPYVLFHAWREWGFDDALSRNTQWWTLVELSLFGVAYTCIFLCLRRISHTYLDSRLNLATNITMAIFVLATLLVIYQFNPLRFEEFTEAWYSWKTTAETMRVTLFAFAGLTYLATVFLLILYYQCFQQEAKHFM